MTHEEIKKKLIQMTRRFDNPYLTDAVMELINEINSEINSKIAKKLIQISCRFDNQYFTHAIMELINEINYTIPESGTVIWFKCSQYDFRSYGLVISHLDGKNSVMTDTGTELLFEELGCKDVDWGIVLTPEEKCKKNIIQLNGKKKFELDIQDAPRLMTGEEAIKWCNKSLGGTWRLPTLNELNIIYMQKNEIGNVMNDIYWSSSKYDSTDTGFWCKDLSNGNNYVFHKNRNTAHVRAVRDAKK